jgi:hypothetical protein
LEWLAIQEIVLARLRREKKMKIISAVGVIKTETTKTTDAPHLDPVNTVANGFYERLSFDALVDSWKALLPEVLTRTASIQIGRSGDSTIRTIDKKQFGGSGIGLDQMFLSFVAFRICRPVVPETRA